MFAFYTNGYFETKTKGQRDRSGYFLDENKLKKQWNKNGKSRRYRTNDIREIAEIRNMITMIN